MTAALVSPEFELPISNPVLIFAVAMLIFVIAPAAFERLRVPGMIGLILAGTVFGPNGLGWLARDETIILLGTVGLLYLMFVAGVEIDLHGFSRYRRHSLVFGVITFAVPMLLGLGAGRMLGYGWAASVLLASTLASHTLLAYPIARRLGIGKNPAVTAAVGGTIITDLAALLVLAVIAASVEGELDAAFWLRLVGSLALFSALVLVGLPRLARWFFRVEEDGETSGYVFVLAALFTASFLAEVAGVEPIIGAFLAGLALNRLIPEGSPLANRLHFFGNAVFIPFFLLSVGMLVDVRVMAGSAQAWKVMLVMVVTVVAAKWAAAKLSQRLLGYGAAEGVIMFGLSVPQAAATLAAALIGYRIELFDAPVLNGTILMILVTCTIGPWVVERHGRTLARQEEQQPYEPSEAPQRILIPLSNPATEEALLDLALLIRQPNATEPLLPITVVSPDGRGAPGRVAAAEKMLSHAVVYAAAAEVPVVPLTRLDRNPAGGIIRGMAESRATTLIAGWDGRTRRFGTFDGVLDQLLERTQQELWIARIQQPLNTSTRVVVALPAESHRSPGFYDAARAVKLLANRLGAPTRAYVVGGDPDRYRGRLDAIRPAVPIEISAAPGWSELVGALGRELRPSDLLVLLSARRSTIAWERELDTLPRALAGRLASTLLIVYPSESPPQERERRSRQVLPRILTPERVLFDLPDLPHEEAIAALLRTEFEADPARVEELTRAVVGGDRRFFTELRPGVGIAHARLDDLPESLLFLGISPPGIRFPGVQHPSRLVFLLLTPRDRPYEHLEHLASITQGLGAGGRVEQLCGCRTPEDLFSWFRADEPAGAAG